jgi:hypothetical protein
MSLKNNYRVRKRESKSMATLAVRVKRGGGGWVVDKASSQILAQLSAMAADDSSPVITRRP